MDSKKQAIDETSDMPLSLLHCYEIWSPSTPHGLHVNTL